MRYGRAMVPGDEQAGRRRRARRRWARRGLEVVLIVAALYLAVEMFAAVGWEALERELRGAHRDLLALTAVLLACRWLVWNTRWRLALRAVDMVVTRRRSLFAILAGAALNHITPSFRLFGGLVRARYVSERPGRTFATGYGTVIFDQIANQTVMGALAAIAFVTLSWKLGRHGEVLAGALAMVSAALLLPLLYRRLERRRLLPSTTGEPDLASRVGPRLRPLAEHGRAVLDTLQRLFADRALVVEAVLLGLVLAAFNLAAAWVAFAALGTALPASWVFFSVSLGVTIGAISGTPGGGLTTEAAMVTCYTLLGADRTVALAATLLYRGLHYALVVLLGLPSLAVLESLHRRAAGRDGPRSRAGA